MSPTTRARNKRLRSDMADASSEDMNEQSQTKKVLKTASAQDSVMTSAIITNHCRLLEVPPEIRNRIYRFTAHDQVDSYAPLLRLSKPATPQTDGFRSFLALAQTNKQLRAEYRPLWLRTLELRVRIEQLGQFFSTFYPKDTDLQHMPKLFQISWDTHNDGRPGVKYDITPLLRLRAFSSELPFEIVPHKLAEGFFPEEECEYCNNDVMPDYDDELTCTCGDFDQEDWMIDVEDDMMVYTNYLLDFILNDNKAWLGDLRVCDMTVICCNNDRIRWTFEIIFHKGAVPKPLPKPLCQVNDQVECAWNYLKDRGIFHDGRDFTVKFEKARTVKLSDGYEGRRFGSHTVHIKRPK